MNKTPWNKNKKNIYSKEVIEKMRLAKLGKRGIECNRYINGKITNDAGYICILSPDHPYHDNKRYVKEHRLVIEKYLGRYLLPEETVHHAGISYPINSKENKSDNRLENLMAFITRSSHKRWHKNSSLVKPNEIIFDGRIL